MASRRRRTIAAVVAALALVFQSLLPIAEAAAATAPHAAGERLLICTAFGFRTINAPGEKQDHGAPLGAHEAKCPLCLNLHQAGGLLPELTPPAVTALILVRHEPPSSNAFDGRWSASRPQPRAPPLPA